MAATPGAARLPVLIVSSFPNEPDAQTARFETVDAEIKEVEGTRVSVATPAALYRLKKGTVRPKDHQDAAALRERFDLKDEA